MISGPADPSVAVPSPTVPGAPKCKKFLNRSSVVIRRWRACILNFTQLSGLVAGRKATARIAVDPSAARRNYEAWAVIAGSLAAGAAYAWFAGEDINWDWRNYHEYSAYAWIHGRVNEDVAPAGVDRKSVV